MFLLKKVLAALILPPISLLLLALFGLWLARRRPRLGSSLAVLSLCTLLVLATPWVANELLRSLQGAPPPTLAELGEAQAIVILGGGTYRHAPEYGSDVVNDLGLERLRYGARLARQAGLPVAITGGAPSGGTPEAEAMRETMESDFRVAVRWLELESLDTRQNAALLAPQLKAAGVTHIALVTHAWHMRRARHLFEQQGLTVVPAATGYAPTLHGGLVEQLPGAKALCRSQIALHEWLGLLVDRLYGELSKVGG